MKNKIIKVLSLILLLCIACTVFACSNTEGEGWKSNLELNVKSVEILRGETYEITALLNGHRTSNAEWSSSDESVCTVEKGIISGESEGEATITAKFKDSTATCQVTVVKNLQLLVLNLSDYSVAMSVSEQKEVSAITKYDGEEVSAEYDWKVKDTSVCSITNGKISGIYSGVTEIEVTATYKGLQTTKLISVTVQPDFTVEFEKEEIRLVSQKITDQDKTSDSIEYAVSLDDKDLTDVAQIQFTSLDEEIVTVDEKGTVSAVNIGQTYIEVIVKIEEYGTAIYKLPVIVERAIVTLSTMDFEVYKSTENGICYANVLKVPAENYFQAKCNATLVSEKGVKSECIAQKIGKNYVIYGDSFGAKVYGEVVVTITLDTIILQLKVNVVTKYLNSLHDLQNMCVYGGIDKTDYYNYDGYYILTTDIECDPNVAYENHESFGFYYEKKMTNGDWFSAGFGGIFDGQGHTINNFYIYGAASNAYEAQNKGALFGNVRYGAVVKNLGINAWIDTPDDSNNKGYVYILAHQFYGTLSNCYISIKPKDDRFYGQIGVVNGTSCAVVENCVIKLDYSAGKNYENLVLFSHEIACPYATTKLPKFKNLHIFVNEPYISEEQGKEPTKKTVNLFDWYWTTKEEVYPALDVDALFEQKKVNKYEYDQKLDSIALDDMTYWEMVDGQPIFKTSKK